MCMCVYVSTCACVCEGDAVGGRVEVEGFIISCCAGARVGSPRHESITTCARVCECVSVWYDRREKVETPIGCVGSVIPCYPVRACVCVCWFVCAQGCACVCVCFYLFALFSPFSPLPSPAPHFTTLHHLSSIVALW